MKISDKIEEWLREQIISSNKKGIVVGLSGGIDSAVVAVLAKKALKSNVLGLILPCKNVVLDKRLALRLADKFKIKTRTINLCGAYNKLESIYPKAGRVVKANLKARLRMTTLYYAANVLDYLVAGTGNKSELTIGYFTKYGDGGCDILPIGGLLKVEVRRLASELSIPSEIIDRAPTAGLWAGQTDEAEIGISYDCLDECLQAIDKNNESRVKKKVLSKTKLMIKNSEHKRLQPPVFTAV